MCAKYVRSKVQEQTKKNKEATVRCIRRLCDKVIMFISNTMIMPTGLNLITIIKKICSIFIMCISAKRNNIVISDVEPNNAKCKED